MHKKIRIKKVKSAQKQSEHSRKNMLISSFRKLRKKESIFCVIADLLFILFSILIVLFCMAGFSRILDGFEAVIPKIAGVSASISAGGNINLQQSDLDNIKSVVEGMFTKIWVVFVLCILALVIGTGSFKGFIWSRVSGNKLSWQYMLRFLGINLIWLGIWSVLLVLILLKISVPNNLYVVVFGGLIVWYLTLVIYAIFNITGGLDGFLKGMLKVVFRMNIIDYFLIVVFFVLLVNLLLLAISASVWLFLGFIIIFLFFVHWSRMYFLLTVRRDYAKD